MISIDDFKKIEIKIGKIISVEKVPDTGKLLRLEVDMGLKPSSQKEDGSPDHLAEQNDLERKTDIRQIISGIALYFSDIQVLVGKKCAFVANLEPRTIRGLESQGMIMAASTEDGSFSLLEVSDSIPTGTLIK